MNLYATNSLTVQPLDFTVLSEAADPVPHREITETFYKLSSSDTRLLFAMACLQEDVIFGMKRVHFNAMLFTEDTERYVYMSNIVCALIPTVKIP